MRRRNLLSAKPNPAHVALARLEAQLTSSGGEMILATQNIDDLHEQAGSEQVLHMHGELLKAQCAACGAVNAWRDDLGSGNLCPSCHQTGSLRPHVVWFGEMPLFMALIGTALRDADLFVAIGTSGSVYELDPKFRTTGLVGRRAALL
jgi:NAD-dependent deacetylase